MYMYMGLHICIYVTHVYNMCTFKNINRVKLSQQCHGSEIPLRFEGWLDPLQINSNNTWVSPFTYIIELFLKKTDNKIWSSVG